MRPRVDAEADAAGAVASVAATTARTASKIVVQRARRVRIVTSAGGSGDSQRRQ
jgi:hypothetical protein